MSFGRGCRSYPVVPSTSFIRADEFAAMPAAFVIFNPKSVIAVPMSVESALGST